MDANKQPGIRFTGVDVASLTFAISGQIPKPIPSAISFEITSRLSDDGNSLDIVMKTDLFGGLPENERPPIELNFVLHGQFEATPGENMSVQEFARHYAPAHLIPYVRELIANITSRSILPTLNLGPINVIAMIDAKEASFEITSAQKKAQQL